MIIVVSVCLLRCETFASKKKFLSSFILSLDGTLTYMIFQIISCISTHTDMHTHTHCSQSQQK